MVEEIYDLVGWIEDWAKMDGLGVFDVESAARSVVRIEVGFASLGLKVEFAVRNLYFSKIGLPVRDSSLQAPAAA